MIDILPKQHVDHYIGINANEFMNYWSFRSTPSSSLLKLNFPWVLPQPLSLSLSLPRKYCRTAYSHHMALPQE